MVSLTALPQFQKCKVISETKNKNFHYAQAHVLDMMQKEQKQFGQKHKTTQKGACERAKTARSVWMCAANGADGQVTDQAGTRD